LNFVISGRVEAAAVRDAIVGSGPEWLRDVNVLDVYQLEAAGTIRRSVTFELAFSNEKSDHSVVEISLELERMTKEVESRFDHGAVMLRR
jgi:phenylalanyl-tRNA synthetase beta subunit